jgi:hypothetical protein
MIKWDSFPPQWDSGKRECFKAHTFGLFKAKSWQVAPIKTIERKEDRVGKSQYIKYMVFKTGVRTKRMKIKRRT